MWNAPVPWPQVADENTTVGPFYSAKKFKKSHFRNSVILVVHTYVGNDVISLGGDFIMSGNLSTMSRTLAEGKDRVWALFILISNQKITESISSPSKCCPKCKHLQSSQASHKSVND